jgi:tetratricopeptide (TPR) repeat protein
MTASPDDPLADGKGKMTRDAAGSLRAAREALARGNLDQAISGYRATLRADGATPGVHRDLGRAYLKVGWCAEAERCLRVAIARDPADHGAYRSLGAVLLAQGCFSACRRAYQRSAALWVRACLPRFLRWKIADPVTAAPNGPTAGIPSEAAHVDRMLDEGGLTEEAVGALERIASEQPDSVDCQMALARAYSALGRVEQAAASAEAALRLDPASALVLASVSASLHPWNNEHAERFARRALEIDPGLELAHASLSNALWGQGRLDEAEMHCREAVRLNPSRLVNRLNFAVIIRQRGRIEEARELYRAIDPAKTGSARACADYGNLILESGGDPDEARRWYRRAQSGSDDARAHLLEAVLDLSCGKLASGWDRYEARKQTDERRWHREYARFPEWDGKPLGDRQLLVYGEQGLGDEIMFASMLADVRRRATRVTLLCDARLRTLFERSFPAVEIVGAELERRGERAAALTGIDCHIAAGSLGRFFRRRAEDFPRHRGYLVPDPARTAGWGAQLAALGTGLKIGLSWRGGVQGTGRSRRSLSLDALWPVLEQPGAHWVSLQHAVESDELARYGAEHGTPIAHFEGVTHDLDDLAALIASLDLVVSVCNTNVHLAGALGKPVWVMAPLVPEWRYGRSGERMLWYPSARVFRQARYGDWESVVQRVAAGVAARVRTREEEKTAGRPIVGNAAP